MPANMLMNEIEGRKKHLKKLNEVRNELKVRLASTEQEIVDLVTKITSFEAAIDILTKKVPHESKD